jgi:hypothetical protein
MSCLQTILFITIFAGPLEGLAQPSGDTLAGKLAEAALERTTHFVRYDGSYRRIDYPNGDVPDDTGVCTDVVIRAYRAIGIDLQRLVHEDMENNFSDYPSIWGLHRTDSNIDHRRVPNLQKYFERQAASIPVSSEAGKYLPGDLVTWMLPGNLPHIGVVTSGRSETGQRHLIVHNINAGPVIEDVLFKFPITGHYRYPGSNSTAVEAGNN